MRKLLILICMVMLAGVASAEVPYWIDDELNVTIPVTCNAGSSVAYSIEKTAGYSPNASDVFVFFDDFNELNYNKWSVISGTGWTASNGYLSKTTAGGWDGVTTPVQTSGNYTYEVQMNHAGDSLMFKFFDQNGTATSNLGYAVYLSSTKADMYETPSNTVHDTVSTDTNNHTYKVSRTTAGVFKWWYDGIYQGSFSDSTGTISNYITCWLYDAGGAFDNIIVSKYVVNEPSVSILDTGNSYIVEITAVDALNDYQLMLNGSELDISSSTESLYISESLQGSGTQKDPFQIYSLSQWQSMNDNLSAYYIQMNDIDAEGATINPIGGNVSFGSLNPGSALTELDGNNHTISNVIINEPGREYVGLIGNGYAHHLNIENITVTGYRNVAPIACGSANNVSTSGTISALYSTYGYGAGVVADANQVINCYSTCNISGTRCGGIAAQGIYTTDITNCYFAGTITGNGAGIIFTGDIEYGNPVVTSCYWNSDLLNLSSSYGEGKTTSQMQTQSTYDNWDFTNVWIMNGYPAFRAYFSTVSFSITVRDESTYDLICPDSVKIYSENILYSGVVNCTSNTTLVTTYLLDSAFIISVSKDGYYTRQMIADSYSVENDVNMFLINESETVIYDRFALTDYIRSYDYLDCIIRLDKPFENGTETVYSSYFDYNGIAATYLIASDQYLLYIITPDRTISYGWLTPDSDGEISIVINEFEFEDLEDWLQYSYEESDSSVTFEYESSKALESATFAINNGTEIYNSTISTDTGSFTYLFEGNGTYQISISVLTEDGYEYVYKSVREIGQSQDVEFFPDSYSIVLKSLIVMFFIVVGVLGLSAFRADLAGIYAASLYAFSVYQDWCSGNEYTVSVVGILAIAAIVKFHRKNNRSLN